MANLGPAHLDHAARTIEVAVQSLSARLDEHVGAMRGLEGVLKSLDSNLASVQEQVKVAADRIDASNKVASDHASQMVKWTRNLCYVASVTVLVTVIIGFINVVVALSQRG